MQNTQCFETWQLVFLWQKVFSTEFCPDKCNAFSTIKILHVGWLLHWVDSGFSYRFIFSTGYYCESGVDRPDPGSSATAINCSCPETAVHTGIGAICPKGFYCPSGSERPLSCVAGTYADMEGMSSCTPCEAGYYCLANTTDYNDNPCPAGYFCPEGTEYSTQHPCQPGTYNGLETRTLAADCIACPAGEYCESQGLASPTGNCSEGWYCSGGSDNATTMTYGGECQPGYYCPEGKHIQIISCFTE